MGSLLHRVGDPATEQGGEFEGVSAASGGDRQARQIRIARDPEVLVGCVAVGAECRVDDLGVDQIRQGGREKLAQLSGLLGRRDEIVPRRDLDGVAVMSHLDHRVDRVKREAVVAGA